MCPADVVNQNFYLRQIYLTSYVWNGAVVGFSALKNGAASTFKLSQFKADAILMWENEESRTSANGYVGQWNDTASFPDEGISARHGKGGVAGMFGGSSQRINLLDFYELASGTTTVYTGGAGTGWYNIFRARGNLPNELWCNPQSPYGSP